MPLKIKLSNGDEHVFSKWHIATPQGDGSLHIVENTPDQKLVAMFGAGHWVSAIRSKRKSG